MAAKFLERMLATTKFPTTIAAWVIETYGPRYAEALVQNHNLGKHTRNLLSYNLSTEDLFWLVYTRNPGVLDALLSSKERADKVLVAIAYTWTLSPSDQVRFVSRRLSRPMARWVEWHSNFTPEAVGIAAGYYQTLPAGRLGWGYCIEGASEVVETSQVRNPTRFTRRLMMDAGEHMQVSIKELGESLSYLSVPERILSGVLGQGRDTRSQSAWQYFMGLIDGDPVVPLKDVLESAKRLANAE